MAARTYSPGGKSHQILSRLVEGPATLAQLRYTCAVTDDAAKRRKQWYIVQALLEDGLIELVGDRYQITVDGHHELARLSACAGAPNARVFA